jgi:protein SCO1/2
VNRRLVAAPAALAALAALLVAGCSSSGSPAKPSELVGQNRVGQYLGAGLDPAQPRPSFTLRDTTGAKFAFGTVTAHHPTFLYFGYTNCPDICPETMADIRIALTKVAASIASNTYVVFVTTDVKHDTGPVIAEWLANFSRGSKATWVGLRGTQAQIDAAQAAAHVTVAEDEGQTHSAQALLYGPDDYAHVTFLESTQEQQQMAHDLPIVAGESS